MSYLTVSRISLELLIVRCVIALVESTGCRTRLYLVRLKWELVVWLSLKRQSGWLVVIGLPECPRCVLRLLWRVISVVSGWVFQFGWIGHILLTGRCTYPHRLGFIWKIAFLVLALSLEVYLGRLIEALLHGWFLLLNFRRSIRGIVACLNQIRIVVGLQARVSLLLILLWLNLIWLVKVVIGSLAIQLVSWLWTLMLSLVRRRLPQSQISQAHLWSYFRERARY